MQSKTLGLLDSMKLAAKYGIRFAPHKTVRSAKKLAAACSAIGFPVALKAISRNISHKTEAGAVATSISSIAGARKAYSKMSGLKGFEGVVVQKMVSGHEIIIGGKRDVQFGPTVLVGLGGVFVEVFKDFSVGICPITAKEARQMVGRLKAYPLLRGYRGRPGVNLSKLAGAIVKASRLMVKETTVEELDLNPIIGNERELLAVDARVVVKG